jgi:hypothetical protein
MPSRVYVMGETSRIAGIHGHTPQALRAMRDRQGRLEEVFGQLQSVLDDGRVIQAEWYFDGDDNPRRCRVETFPELHRLVSDIIRNRSCSALDFYAVKPEEVPVRIGQGTREYWALFQPAPKTGEEPFKPVDRVVLKFGE